MEQGRVDVAATHLYQGPGGAVQEAASRATTAR